MGNGKKLSISNVGLSQLYTLTNSISIISVPNVLYVPNMKKNLISVSQLARDHNVIAEFHSDSCLIKDMDLELVLLQGILKDGLYQLASAFAHAVSKAVSSVRPRNLAANVSSSLNKCKG